ncbi:putative neuraminidase (sialidase) [Luteitalea pratensis]|uniref:Putative neuraminidase (Sialidase) n=1 Tax=Luteitalea pratensis TaxID=1855912 RepID=A0A143PU96_LUTPR|nr:sialidase family protein [Luteitalea pratensis]AMY11748.1 putative neuraminidase (sialidase) [Luteitalea pratensis]
MNRRTFLASSAVLLAASTKSIAQGSAEHVTVWREPGRYGGWPANHGIWSWGDEILVGFTAGVLKTDDMTRHPIDRSAGERHVLSRSLDGGRTWRLEEPATLQPPRPERRAVTGEPLRLPALQPLARPIDFTAPGLALTFRTAHGTTGAWLFASTDRGRTWQGPYAVPAFDTPGLDPRTDYLVLGRHELLVGMTALKTNGKEGRPFALRTRDGGLTWERLGWIGPETDGFRIMPATAALGANHLFSVIRRRDDTRHSLEGYRTRDGGATWVETGIVAADTGRGNPASLVRLGDGRLCCVYGYRAEPFDMRVVVSGDDGASWSTPRPLREGASDWDLGYPRSVVRPDGRVVSVYYFNDASSPERYIAATIWTP